MIFDAKNPATRDLLDHGLEPALRQLAKEQLGDPETTLGEGLLVRLVDTGQETGKPLRVHPLRNRLDPAALEFEVSRDLPHGFATKNPLHGEHLTDLAYLGRKRVG